MSSSDRRDVCWQWYKKMPNFATRERHKQAEGKKINKSLLKIIICLCSQVHFVT